MDMITKSLAAIKVTIDRAARLKGCGVEEALEILSEQIRLLIASAWQGTHRPWADELVAEARGARAALVIANGLAERFPEYAREGEPEPVRDYSDD